MAAYTLRQLKYFLTTVEAGSVAEASRRLHIAQPAISAAIKALEDSFEVRLFIRHPSQGMSLTPAGGRFFRKAEALLRMARDFELNALADNDVVSGQVDVGCYETVAPMVMPRLIASFRDRFPGVRVRLGDGEQQELVAGLNSGRFDVALLYRLDLDPGLEVETLIPALRPHALLPATHPLAGRPEVSLHELAAEPMVLLDIAPSRGYFLEIFQAHGLTPDVVFSSPSLEMVRGMVGQGLGYSLLVTRPHGDTTCDGQRVVSIPIREPVTPAELVAAWPRRSPLTKCAECFVAHCREVLAPGADDGAAAPPLSADRASPRPPAD